MGLSFYPLPPPSLFLPTSLSLSLYFLNAFSQENLPRNSQNAPNLSKVVCPENWLFESQAFCNLISQD